MDDQLAESWQPWQRGTHLKYLLEKKRLIFQSFRCWIAALSFCDNEGNSSIDLTFAPSFFLFHVTVPKKEPWSWTSPSRQWQIICHSFKKRLERIASFLGGGFKIFSIFAANWGNWSNLTTIFQICWNHQLLVVWVIIEGKINGLRSWWTLHEILRAKWC